MLENSEVIKLNGDFGLFGDDTIIFISTPEHTEGHQSLLLKLKDTGSIIISGDIAYYKKNYQENGIPTFNTNKKNSLASIKKIKQLIDCENAQLWIQHDKEHFETLKLSPKYYQ